MSSNGLLKMEMHISATDQTMIHPSPFGGLVPLPNKKSTAYLRWYDRVACNWPDAEFVDEKFKGQVTVLAKNRHGCTMVVGSYVGETGVGSLWEFPDLNFEGYDPPVVLGGIVSAF